MDVLFWASKSKVPFTPIIKLGRPRIFLNITLIVFLPYEVSHKHRGWLEGEQIMG